MRMSWSYCKTGFICEPNFCIFIHQKKAFCHSPIDICASPCAGVSGSEREWAGVSGCERGNRHENDKNPKNFQEIFCVYCNCCIEHKSSKEVLSSWIFFICWKWPNTKKLGEFKYFLYYCFFPVYPQYTLVYPQYILSIPHYIYCTAFSASISMPGEWSGVGMHETLKFLSGRKRKKDLTENTSLKVWRIGFVFMQPINSRNTNHMI